jgi:hypothetical protein
MAGQSQINDEFCQIYLFLAHLKYGCEISRSRIQAWRRRLELYIPDMFLTRNRMDY